MGKEQQAWLEQSAIINATTTRTKVNVFKNTHLTDRTNVHSLISIEEVKFRSDSLHLNLSVSSLSAAHVNRPEEAGIRSGSSLPGDAMSRPA